MRSLVREFNFRQNFLLGVITCGLLVISIYFAINIIRQNLLRLQIVNRIVTCTESCLQGQAVINSDQRPAAFLSLLSAQNRPSSGSGGLLMWLAWALPGTIEGSQTLLEIAETMPAETFQASTRLEIWRQMTTLYTDDIDENLLKVVYLRLMAAHYFLNYRATESCASEYFSLRYSILAGVWPENAEEALRRLLTCPELSIPQQRNLTIVLAFLESMSGQSGIPKVDLAAFLQNDPLRIPHIYLALQPILEQTVENPAVVLQQFMLNHGFGVAEGDWLYSLEQQSSGQRLGDRELILVEVDTTLLPDSAILPVLLGWRASAETGGQASDGDLKIEVRLLPNFVPNGGFVWGGNQSGVPIGWQYFQGYRGQMDAHSVKKAPSTSFEDTGYCISMNSAVTPENRAGLQGISLDTLPSSLLLMGAKLYANGNEANNARIGYYWHNPTMQLSATPVGENAPGDYAYRHYSFSPGKPITPYLIHWQGNSPLCIGEVFLIGID